MAITDAAKCDSKSKRTGEPCNNAAMENGKCRLHGGKTPKGIASPNFKTGKHSKFAYLPANLLPRTENLLTNTLDNLEESIQIQKSLETTYLEKLGTTESTEAWKRLRQAVKDYDNATHTAKNEGEKAMLHAQAFGMIKFIVNEGLSESFLHSDIMRVQESQRKITETLSKCRKEQQQIYTLEEVKVLVGVFLQVIKNNVRDTGILNSIQAELSTKVLATDAVN